MTRERLAWLLAVVVMALGAWWLSANTEWVEEDRRRPAQGEARDNPVYAFEQLLRRLGMHAEHHEALDALPPRDARLVLLSSDWELIPGRAEQLHQWVLGGGHLVLPQHGGWDDTPLAKWVPVEAVYVKTFKPRRPPQQSRAVGLPTPAASAASAPSAVEPESGELTSEPPLWGDTETVEPCHLFDDDESLRTKPRHGAAWTLMRERIPPAKPSTQVLRVAIGQGSVTVLNASGRAFHNALALDCDNPLVLAAAVQAEPGATAWIYLNEKREALLPWLWHQGWIAIVAGLLALAAALWRGAVRFGPRMAPPPRLRRSITEQVRGLGAYLQGGGREALLVAQQRALNEVAARTVRRYAHLSVPDRARAIAGMTGLAADEIAKALSARFCTRVELARYLPVLETARRQLHRTPEERPQP